MTMQQVERANLFGSSDNLKAAFNQAPVLIAHALNDHPLLSLSAIAALAEKLSAQSTPRGFFNLPADQPAPGTWGSASFRAAVAAGLAKIESSGMRLKLSSVHLEPGYRELLNECSTQLDSLTGGILLSEFPEALATLFISSPGEITPYHVDSEINFLFQIAGTKTIHIYDGSDRSLIDTSDFERYWGLGLIEMPEGVVGQDFVLRPGIGIHNPVHFPHWVQNGPTPSVSLSVGFRSPRDVSEVYRVNHELRRLGFSPAKPGSNPRLDDAKRVALRSVLSVKHLLKGGKTPLMKVR